ncbi:unnamed protein product [Meloidogyne enterolobii]|uniref:Uncharacterized protein n=1 Tax=Meloidogyne enterolobii TaxID=390850 RepID=A0ACB0Z2P1_MELEN
MFKTSIPILLFIFLCIISIVKSDDKNFKFKIISVEDKLFCVHITCARLNSPTRQQKIIKDTSQNTIVFEVLSNLYSNPIKMPGDCNPLIKLKFYITPRIVLPGTEYCEADGKNGPADKFDKWTLYEEKVGNGTVNITI